ncbi:MAG: YeeE/YedE family protein [Pseudomonadota bacterium]
MHPYLVSLAGGLLIGLSAALLLILNGRIAGISGIVGRLVSPQPGLALNIAFVAGLVIGPLGYLAIFGGWPEVRLENPLPMLLLAGLLVGFGTRMGSGCTSGHGVVGLARLSRRSIAAVATFMTTAVLTVLFLRLGGLL